MSEKPEPVETESVEACLVLSDGRVIETTVRWFPPDPSNKEPWVMAPGASGAAFIVPG